MEAAYGGHDGRDKESVCFDEEQHGKPKGSFDDFEYSVGADSAGTIGAGVCIGVGAAVATGIGVNVGDASYCRGAVAGLRRRVVGVRDK